MGVALHSAPEGFFKSNLPHDSSELFSLIRKASSLSFKCFQLGSLSNFVEIDGKQLKTVLDQYGMEKNVHGGGLYDAEKFAVTEEEYGRAQKEINGNEREIVERKQLLENLIMITALTFRPTG
jgi:hypothetical protein